MPPGIRVSFGLEAKACARVEPAGEAVGDPRLRERPARRSTTCRPERSSRRIEQDHTWPRRCCRRTFRCPRSRRRCWRRSRPPAATRSARSPARGSAARRQPHIPSPRRRFRSCGSRTGRRAAALAECQQKLTKRPSAHRVSDGVPSRLPARAPGPRRRGPGSPRKTRCPNACRAAGAPWPRGSRSARAPARTR